MQSRLLSLKSSSCSSVVVVPTLLNSKRTSYLLTSYYAKNQFPFQQVVPHYRVKKDFRENLKSSYAKQTVPKTEEELKAIQEEQDEKMSGRPRSYCVESLKFLKNFVDCCRKQQEQDEKVRKENDDDDDEDNNFDVEPIISYVA